MDDCEQDDRALPAGASAYQRALDRIDAVQRCRPLLAFPFAVLKKFGDDRASRLAALVSYYGFFSLFPLLLVLTTGLGFVLSGNEELRREVVATILRQFPEMGGRIERSVGSLRGSGFGLAVGVAGLLWTGMGVMSALQDAMNTVWGVPIKRQPNFWKKRLVALTMLALLGLGFLAASLLTNLGRIEHLAGFGAGGTVLSVLFDFALFLLAFRVLTERRDLGWAAFVPGAAVGAVGWFVLQWLGGFYVASAVRGASATYGFFAVMLGLLSWMHVLAQWVVFSAEVNVVHHDHLWPRTFFGDTLRERDREALIRYAKVEERYPEQVIDVRFADEQPGLRYAPDHDGDRTGGPENGGGSTRREAVQPGDGEAGLRRHR
ncbi:MAG: YihY/virulence factor BrkB family protein [Acidimicrobiia bacterium]